MLHVHLTRVVVAMADAWIIASQVKVFKRPGLDKFLNCMAKAFEVVVFTAAIPQYAQPVLNRIDPRGRIAWRLFRDSTCVYNVSC